MNIRDIFAKQIDRPINGVIKADQSDSETVWQELDEYVIIAVYSRVFFRAPTCHARENINLNWSLIPFRAFDNIFRRQLDFVIIHYF